MKRFRGVLALLTLALAVGTPGLAHAQGLSGQIGGSVVDDSKGRVPGATVTVRNTATAVTRGCRHGQRGAVRVHESVCRARMTCGSR